VSLTELVEFAKGRVPKGMWIETEVRLMATAGMRLLELPVQEKILGVARRVLKSSGFLFRDEWASVISGEFSKSSLLFKSESFYLMPLELYQFLSRSF